LARKKSQALVARPVGLKILGAPFELYPTGLTIIGKPTQEEYDEAFGRLNLIESAQSWWYGDLANAREKHYGSLDEMADRLEIDYNALHVYQYVSSRYEHVTRVTCLTFKHHQIAAPLDDRLEWLRKAGKNNWSTRNLELEINKAKRLQLALPEGIYDVIYADPPWQYSNALPQWGAAETHYRTMSMEELCNIKIPVADNAALFLWVTNPFLRDAFQVIDAWGFEYKTNLVWVKDKLKKPGSGFWIRGRHELLFICGRGSFLPDQTGKHPIGSVIEEPVVLNDPVQEHSRKPERVYELIEYLYPGRRYLELFARNSHKHWTSWGDEITD